MSLLPRFPELESLFKGCKQKCILDGELIVLVNGKPDFYEVQRRTVLTDPFKIELAHKKHSAGFVAYDILYYKDKPATDLPLMERKKLLEEVISESDILSKSRYVETNGIAMYKFAEDYNLEGYTDATWINPMVCRIEYMPSEKEGIRQPTFKDVLDEKLPEECRL